MGEQGSQATISKGGQGSQAAVSKWGQVSLQERQGTVSRWWEEQVNQCLYRRSRSSVEIEGPSNSSHRVSPGCWPGLVISIPSGTRVSPRQGKTHQLGSGVRQTTGSHRMEADRWLQSPKGGGRIARGRIQSPETGGQKVKCS